MQGTRNIFSEFMLRVARLWPAPPHCMWHVRTSKSFLLLPPYLNAPYQHTNQLVAFYNRIPELFSAFCFSKNLVLYLHICCCVRSHEWKELVWERNRQRNLMEDQGTGPNNGKLSISVMANHGLRSNTKRKNKWSPLRVESDPKWLFTGSVFLE